MSWGLMAMSGPRTYWLTAEAFSCRACGWADELSRTNHDGQAVIEGILWRQACRDHGFWGAVAKVKAAYRLRQQRLHNNAREVTQ